MAPVITVAVPQRAPPLANGGGGHVALRQEIASQAIANLVGIDAVVLLFRCRNGPQHQRVGHLQGGCMPFEVIVDPAGEHRCFHRRTPRLWQRFHPAI